MASSLVCACAFFARTAAFVPVAARLPVSQRSGHLRRSSCSVALARGRGSRGRAGASAASSPLGMMFDSLAENMAGVANLFSGQKTITESRCAAVMYGGVVRMYVNFSACTAMYCSRHVSTSSAALLNPPEHVLNICRGRVLCEWVCDVWGTATIWRSYVAKLHAYSQSWVGRTLTVGCVFLETSKRCETLPGSLASLFYWAPVWVAAPT